MADRSMEEISGRVRKALDNMAALAERDGYKYKPPTIQEMIGLADMGANPELARRVLTASKPGTPWARIIKRFRKMQRREMH